MISYLTQQHRTLEDMERECSVKVSNEYSNDINTHLFAMEQATKCDSNMIDMQPELEWDMRPFLMDFLVESHQGLDLSIETLFLAVNLIDRYSSKRVIYKRHYQLVGCVSLWIASKYCDQKHKVPTLHELMALCCGAYDRHMFTQMEHHILNTLNWVVGHPTCDQFVDQLLDNFHYCCDQAIWRQVSLYLCETAMFHKALLVHSSSIVASASVKLAAIITSNVAVMNSMACHTNAFTNGETNECFNKLVQLVQHSHKLQAQTATDCKYSKRERLFAYNIVQSFLTAMAATTQATQQQQQQQQQQCPSTPPPALVTPCQSPTSTASSPAFSGVCTPPPQQQPHTTVTTPFFYYANSKTPPLQQSNEFASQFQKGIYHQPAVSTGYMTPPFTPNDIMH